MDSERFASPIEGIFCGGLNAYCMHIRPLFLRTSGSSGVLKALLLERNGQLSCNPKKKKKKKTVSISCLQLPARLTWYVTAFKALQPHRLLKVDAMPAEDVLNEPIFFNRQISVPLGSSATGSANGSAASRPLTPHDQPLMLAAGVTKLAHLQVALLQQHPPTFTASLQSVLTTIPPPWRAIVTAAPTAPTWQQGLSASGSQLIQNTQTGQRHSLSSHDQLQQSHAQLATATSHVRVISWDPSLQASPS